MAMSNSAMSKAPLFPPATAPTPRLRSCMERLWWRLIQPAPASLLYVTVSLLWLLGEDLLAWANDIRQPAILDLLRVALAIAVSGGLLYWLLRTHADAIARARFAQRQVEDRLRQSLEAMEAQAAERAAERGVIKRFKGG